MADSCCLASLNRGVREVTNSPWDGLAVVGAILVVVVTLFASVAQSAGTQCTSLAAKAIDGFIVFGDFLMIVGFGLSIIVYGVMWYFSRKVSSGYRRRSSSSQRERRWWLWIPAVLFLVGLVVSWASWWMALESGEVCVSGLVSEWFISLL